MSGGTAWQFDSKGVIVLRDTSEQVQELVIGLEVEELELDGDTLTLYADPGSLYTVLEGLREAGLEPEVSQLTKLPQTVTALSPEDSAKVLRLIEALEELDDVQNVYSTAEFADVVEAS